ncbi:hypothetical protein [Paraglaciecola sp.]|uniref:hypothetical protein n=1 Tax=Paraglaciecola sp. TaxID=1920173 RepID=UPI003265C1A8
MKLYLLISILMFLFILMGFGPDFYMSVMGGFHQSLMLHIHAIIFIGWFVLFAIQAILPAFGRLDLHIKLGQFAFFYAILVVANGLYVTLTTFQFRIGNVGEHLARYWLLQPLTDMIVFPALVSAAFYYRKKPEIHKRLMLLATLVMTIVSLVRVTYIPMHGAKLVIWLAPIIIAMGYDYYTKKIIHPVYMFGLVLFTIIYCRKTWLFDTLIWTKFSTWLVVVVG